MLNLKFLIALVLMNFADRPSKPQLVYFSNPTCPKCFDITSELDEVMTNFRDDFELRMVVGGHETYDETSKVDLSNYLGNQPTNSTRIKLDSDYDNAQYIDDVEQATKATMIVRHLNPALEFEFFMAIQEALYVEHKDLQSLDTYLTIIDQLELNREFFIDAFNSPEMLTAVEQEFESSIRMGVSQFPTILLLKDGEYYQVSQGQTSSEKIESRIEMIMRR